MFHEVLARKLKTATPFSRARGYLAARTRLAAIFPDGKAYRCSPPDGCKRHGNWSGMGRDPRKGEPVLDEDDGFFAEAMKGGKANRSLCLWFWNNHAAESKQPRDRCGDHDGAEAHRPVVENICLSKIAPADLVACIGSYGQRLYVVPSKKLIIVRLGKGGDFRTTRRS